MADKKKKKRNFAEIILIISALVLGLLIILLVAGNKKKIIIDGGSHPEFSGNYPLPSEITDGDKSTYFAYMEIPDLIFKKMVNVSFTDDCPVTREDLRYVKVLYWGTDYKPHTGELIVNKAIAEKTRDVFYELYKASYPIEQIALIDEYGGNDEVSMSYNNTSCFNARKVAKTDSWSKHAYGMAIDINPLYNPYVGENGTILPISGEIYADRDKVFKMKIDDSDYAYSVFTKAGFTWGGSWEKVKDYQHFEFDN